MGIAHREHHPGKCILAHTIGLMPEELSGGMQRRIALARTPDPAPAHHPVRRTDQRAGPITAKEIIELMLKVQKEYQTSALIITHDMDCARVIANRMIILIDGRNYAEGSYEALSASPDPRFRHFSNKLGGKENGKHGKTGLVHPIAVALFVVAVYLIGSQENMFGANLRISSVFSNVNGLDRAITSGIRASILVRWKASLC